MQKTSLRKKPPYALESVDNALHLLQLLRDEGRLRNKDAADELGIAPSSANRLLSMLVYRGFAVQDETRLYLPGPALGEPPVVHENARALKALVQPHLEHAVRRFRESANLVIRVGTNVRFLSTVESPLPLRVSDRQGAVIPARKASGGKALLAELSPALLERMYLSDLSLPGEQVDGTALLALQEELERVRRSGYAINRESTESGVSAIGISIHGADGEAIAAISIAAPSSRFEAHLDAGLIDFMPELQRRVEADLVASS